MRKKEEREVWDEMTRNGAVGCSVNAGLRRVTGDAFFSGSLADEKMLFIFVILRMIRP